MSSFVSSEAARMGIPSIATRNVARKRPFLTVDSLVPHQRAFLRKAGVTAWKVAFERPFSRMGPHMSLHVTWPVKTFAASWVVTYELLFACACESPDDVGYKKRGSILDIHRRSSV